jgi:4-amino-4-deoxy-L-arabinose transferase-like glycosyltransferase
MRERWTRADTIFLLTLFAVALVPRLYVAIAWAREPVWDGHYYHFGATRIAEGLGYSEDVNIGGQLIWKPWCHYPVGYSGLLGLVYKVFGTGLLVAPVMNALLGAGLAGVIYALGRHCLGQWRARVAGLLCAFHPGLILYTALVMTEPLSALTLALSALGAVLARGRKLGAVLSGVALGLGTLVRPTALLGAPWLFFVWHGPWLRRGLWTALAAAVALLVVSPWTYRNCRVMDGCTLVSSNGGWNLAIGAMTETGRFAPLSAKLGCPGPGQVQQDRCWRDVGVKRIAEDPWHWLSLMPIKLAHTYNHESFAVGYLAEADRKTWPDERKWQGQRVLTVWHHLVMFSALLGAVALCRPPLARWASALNDAEKKRAWLNFGVQAGVLSSIAGYAIWALNQDDTPLYWLIVVAPLVALTRLPGSPRLSAGHVYVWGLVLMTSVTHAVFFGDDRYHLTISPLLCLLAAGALRPPATRDNSAVIDSATS